jgi:LmbE family N-acetylglucosaminyl deacetylase
MPGGMNAMATAPPLRLMAILAHPDDESLGLGGTLARYAAEGVETYLVTATRGERGWTGEPSDNPGLRALGEIRDRELLAATSVLTLKNVDILDYVDGDLDQAKPMEITAKLVGIIRRVRPDVVITFGPDGAFGHPDHMAISHFTTGALMCSADSTYVDEIGSNPGHRVAKLYHKIWTAEEDSVFQAAFGDVVMLVDGAERRAIGWPDWSISARIDTADYWQICWQAISCHRSQLRVYNELLALPEEQHRKLAGNQGFARAFSLVNGGRAMELDLFDGIRTAELADRSEAAGKQSFDVTTGGH